MRARIILFIIVLFFSAQPAICGHIILPQDSNGWTVFTPSADTRIMYVSATGNDSTGQIYSSTSEEVGSNPFNPSKNILPFATYEAAYANVRWGYPDWILISNIILGLIGITIGTRLIKGNTEIKKALLIEIPLVMTDLNTKQKIYSISIIMKFNFLVKHKVFSIKHF